MLESLPLRPGEAAVNDKGRDMPNINAIFSDEVLSAADIDELGELSTAARKLLDRIQEQVEFWSAPLNRPLKRFRFKENGPAFAAENLVDGVLINPALPEDFSCTDNEKRSPEELARWWLRPFIQVESWEDQERFIRSHQEYLKRTGDAELCRPDLEGFIEAQRAAWFKVWTEGNRYEARCLDGGAWDRPTCWGMFPTLQEALACVAERCVAD